MSPADELHGGGVERNLAGEVHGVADPDGL